MVKTRKRDVAADCITALERYIDTLTRRVQDLEGRVSDLAAVAALTPRAVVPQPVAHPYYFTQSNLQKPCGCSYFQLGGCAH